VRKAPDGDLSISWDGATPMQIKVGRFRSALPTLPAHDFPELDPDWRNGMPWDFTVSADALAAMLGPVAFAISTEETRYYLNGIYLHAVEVEDGVTKLRAVSTDGHRLARRDIPAPDGSAGLSGVILPRKTVGELLRLAKDGGDIELGVSASKIRAKTGQSVLVSKLIDGTFPDYQRVIPSNNKSRAVVNRKALSEAADRAGTVSSGDAKAIKLAFGPAGLTVSMNNPDTGSAAEEIDATFSAAPIEIGFNGRYLADVLSNLAGEEIAIDLNEGSSPTLFRPLDDDSLLIVLMPMRIQ
jgi:DNA polymerase III subunit beta